jgi:hypothetical protein
VNSSLKISGNNNSGTSNNNKNMPNTNNSVKESYKSNANDFKPS